jgi:hypothetical protein
MTEEVESPMERVHEDMHHAAAHSQEDWQKWAALLAALYAVLSAVAGMQSAHFANDAMIEQIEASDKWGYYQAKGLKAMTVESEREVLKALGKDPGITQDPARYKQEQEEIKKDAEEKVAAAKAHLQQHEVLARGVTMFQVSIAVIAIGVLSRRRQFVMVSVVMTGLGLFFLLQGLLH